MAVSSVANLGQINAGGSTEALFLKVFAGEVLTTFEEENIMLPRVTVREMPRGAKSLMFPGVGKAYTKRHEVGANILSDNADAANDTPSSTGGATSFLSAPNMGEREVFIDDPLESSAFIDDWEQFKSSFDAMGPISTQLGRILAVDNDIFIQRLIIKGTIGKGSGSHTSLSIDWSGTSLPSEFVQIPAGSSRGTPGAAIEDDDTDGSDAGLMNFVDANAGSDGSTLLDKLRQVSQQFDENDVPDMDRFVGLKPNQYNLLVQNQDLLNRDFGGQNGIFSQGTVFEAWGMTLLKSNHIPTDDTKALTAPTGTRGTVYSVDAQNTVAVCWQRDGLAAVRSGSVSVESDRLIQYRGRLIVSSMATGYEILRPLHIARVGTAHQAG